jgi:hypothetical protein
MVEIVEDFEEGHQAGNLYLDVRTQLVEKRSQPIVVAVLVHQLANFECCGAAVNAALNPFAKSVN